MAWGNTNTNPYFQVPNKRGVGIKRGVGKCKKIRGLKKLRGWREYKSKIDKRLHPVY